MNQKVYTVVALYPDGQSFVEAFIADDPREAGFASMNRVNGDIYKSDDSYVEMEIIAVFEGDHKDVR